MKFAAVVPLLLSIAAQRAAGIPVTVQFRDVSTMSGIEMVVDNSQTEQKYQIEPMIAGVALFDYNGDGLLDVYICNGAHIPQLEKTKPRHFNRLYRNLGNLRFEDVTLKAAVKGAGYSMGVSAGDYDNDGRVDFYVTGVNTNILYHNLGDGTFEDATQKAGVSANLAGRGKAWSVGAGWFDYDHDGDLDLFVVNYCDWSIDKDTACGMDQPGYRTYCHPRIYAPLPNILYRNNGDGTFSDVSMETGVSSVLGKGMGLAFADFDRDGYLDVFVSNDAWRNFLFRNQKDGTFQEIALYAGAAYIDTGKPVSGMGVDFRDYDNDGYPDIFMTALSNETFPLFRNLGDGLFRDERFASGLGVQSLPWAGWSVGMVDFNNDGFLDLFIAGGHVQTNEELYTNRQSLQKNRVFLNAGDGSFEDITEECGKDLQQLGLHRGAAFGDLDNDGRMDVVVTRLNDRVEVFRNETEEPGHFLLVDLRGTKSNRYGLGAEVKLVLESGRILFRHATTAVGYGGSSDPRIHFGLGKENRIKELEITWPGGKRQTVKEVPVDQILIVQQADE